MVDIVIVDGVNRVSYQFESNTPPARFQSLFPGLKSANYPNLSSAQLLNKMWSLSLQATPQQDTFDDIWDYIEKNEQSLGSAKIQEYCGFMINRLLSDKTDAEKLAPDSRLLLCFKYIETSIQQNELEAAKQGIIAIGLMLDSINEYLNRAGLPLKTLNNIPLPKLGTGSKEDDRYAMWLAELAGDIYTPDELLSIFDTNPSNLQSVNYLKSLLSNTAYASLLMRLVMTESGLLTTSSLNKPYFTSRGITYDNFLPKVMESYSNIFGLNLGTVKDLYTAVKKAYANLGNSVYDLRGTGPNPTPYAVVREKDNLYSIYRNNQLLYSVVKDPNIDFYTPILNNTTVVFNKKDDKREFDYVKTLISRLERKRSNYNRIADNYLTDLIKSKSFDQAQAIVNTAYLDEPAGKKELKNYEIYLARYKNHEGKNYLDMVTGYVNKILNNLPDLSSFYKKNEEYYLALSRIFLVAEYYKTTADYDKALSYYVLVETALKKFPNFSLSKEILLARTECYTKMYTANKKANADLTDISKLRTDNLRQLDSLQNAGKLTPMDSLRVFWINVEYLDDNKNYEALKTEYEKVIKFDNTKFNSYQLNEPYKYLSGLDKQDIVLNCLAGFVEYYSNPRNAESDKKKGTNYAQSIWQNILVNDAYIKALQAKVDKIAPDRINDSVKKEEYAEVDVRLLFLFAKNATDTTQAIKYYDILEKLVTKDDQIKELRFGRLETYTKIYAFSDPADLTLRAKLEANIENLLKDHDASNYTDGYDKTRLLGAKISYYAAKQDYATLKNLYLSAIEISGNKAALKAGAFTDVLEADRNELLYDILSGLVELNLDEDNPSADVAQAQKYWQILASVEDNQIKVLFGDVTGMPVLSEQQSRILLLRARLEDNISVRMQIYQKLYAELGKFKITSGDSRYNSFQTRNYWYTVSGLMSVYADQLNDTAFKPLFQEIAAELYVPGAQYVQKSVLPRDAFFIRKLITEALFAQAELYYSREDLAELDKVIGALQNKPDLTDKDNFRLIELRIRRYELSGETEDIAALDKIIKDLGEVSGINTRALLHDRAVMAKSAIYYALDQLDKSKQTLNDLKVLNNATSTENDILKIFNTISNTDKFAKRLYASILLVGAKVTEIRDSQGGIIAKSDGDDDRFEQVVERITTDQNNINTLGLQFYKMLKPRVRLDYAWGLLKEDVVTENQRLVAENIARSSIAELTINSTEPGQTLSFDDIAVISQAVLKALSGVNSSEVYKQLEEAHSLLMLSYAKSKNDMERLKAAAIYYNTVVLYYGKPENAPKSEKDKKDLLAAVKNLTSLFAYKLIPNRFDQAVKLINGNYPLGLVQITPPYDPTKPPILDPYFYEIKQYCLGKLETPDTATDVWNTYKPYLTQLQDDRYQKDIASAGNILLADLDQKIENREITGIDALNKFAAEKSTLEKLINDSGMTQENKDYLLCRLALARARIYENNGMYQEALDEINQKEKLVAAKKDALKQSGKIQPAYDHLYIQYELEKAGIQAAMGNSDEARRLLAATEKLIPDIDSQSAQDDYQFSVDLQKAWLFIGDEDYDSAQAIYAKYKNIIGDQLFGKNDFVWNSAKNIADNKKIYELQKISVYASTDYNQKISFFKKVSGLTQDTAYKTRLVTDANLQLAKINYFEAEDTQTAKDIFLNKVSGKKDDLRDRASQYDYDILAVAFSTDSVQNKLSRLAAILNKLNLTYTAEILVAQAILRTAGKLIAAIEKIDDRQKYFEQVLAAIPAQIKGYAVYYQFLAEYYQETGNYAQAIQQDQNIINIDSGDKRRVKNADKFWAKVSLLDLYKRTGQLAKLKDLKLSEEINNKADQETYRTLLQADQSIVDNKYLEAENILTQFIFADQPKFKPGSKQEAQLLDKLVEVYATEGKTDKLADLYERLAAKINSASLLEQKQTLARLSLKLLAEAVKQRNNTNFQKFDKKFKELIPDQNQKGNAELMIEYQIQLSNRDKDLGDYAAAAAELKKAEGLVDSVKDPNTRKTYLQLIDLMYAYCYAENSDWPALQNVQSALLENVKINPDDGLSAEEDYFKAKLIDLQRMLTQGDYPGLLQAVQGELDQIGKYLKDYKDNQSLVKIIGIYQLGLLQLKAGALEQQGALADSLKMVTDLETGLGLITSASDQKETRIYLTLQKARLLSKLRKLDGETGAVKLLENLKNDAYVQSYPAINNLVLNALADAYWEKGSIAQIKALNDALQLTDQSFTADRQLKARLLNRLMSADIDQLRSDIALLKQALADKKSDDITKYNTAIADLKKEIAAYSATLVKDVLPKLDTTKKGSSELLIEYNLLGATYASLNEKYFGPGVSTEAYLAAAQKIFNEQKIKDPLAAQTYQKLIDLSYAYFYAETRKWDELDKKIGILTENVQFDPADGSVAEEYYYKAKLIQIEKYLITCDYDRTAQEIAAEQAKITDLKKKYPANYSSAPWLRDYERELQLLLWRLNNTLSDKGVKAKRLGLESILNKTEIINRTDKLFVDKYRRTKNEVAPMEVEFDWTRLLDNFNKILQDYVQNAKNWPLWQKKAAIDSLIDLAIQQGLSNTVKQALKILYSLDDTLVSKDVAAQIEPEGKALIALVTDYKKSFDQTLPGYQYTKTEMGYVYYDFYKLAVADKNLTAAQSVLDRALMDRLPAGSSTDGQSTNLPHYDEPMVLLLDQMADNSRTLGLKPAELAKIKALFHILDRKVKGGVFEKIYKDYINIIKDENDKFRFNKALNYLEKELGLKTSNGVYSNLAAVFPADNTNQYNEALLLDLVSLLIQNRESKDIIDDGKIKQLLAYLEVLKNRPTGFATGVYGQVKYMSAKIFYEYFKIQHRRNPQLLQDLQKMIEQGVNLFGSNFVPRADSAKAAYADMMFRAAQAYQQLADNPRNSRQSQELKNTASQLMQEVMKVNESYKSAVDMLNKKLKNLGITLQGGVNFSFSGINAITTFPYDVKDDSGTLLATVKNNTSSYTKDSTDVDVWTRAIYQPWKWLTLQLGGGVVFSSVQENQLLNMNVYSDGLIIPKPGGQETFKRSLFSTSPYLNLGAQFNILDALPAGPLTINKFSLGLNQELRFYTEPLAPQYNDKKYQVNVPSGQDQNLSEKTTAGLFFDFSPQGLEDILQFNVGGSFFDQFSTHSDLVKVTSTVDKPVYDWAGKYYKNELGGDAFANVNLDLKWFYAGLGYRFSWLNSPLFDANDVTKPSYQWTFEHQFPFRLGTYIPLPGDDWSLMIGADGVFRVPQQGSGIEPSFFGPNPILQSIGGEATLGTPIGDFSLRGGVQNFISPQLQNVGDTTTLISDKYRFYMDLSYSIKF